MKKTSLSLTIITLICGNFILQALSKRANPNILLTMADDIGLSNISFNNRGLMGFQTSNIDRIAKEGVAFTDYYGQQSCTAGPAAFTGCNNPVRTGFETSKRYKV